MRAASVFGAFEVCCIGSTPKRSIMRDLSGGTYDIINFKQFSNPTDLIQYCRDEDIKMISFELSTEHFPAVPLSEYRFDFTRRSVIIVGHESFGVPNEILAHSDRVYIQSDGIGFCLNTSQAANIALYIASQQYKEYNK